MGRYKLYISAFSFARPSVLRHLQVGGKAAFYGQNIPVSCFKFDVDIIKPRPTLLLQIMQPYDIGTCVSADL